MKKETRNVEEEKMEEINNTIKNKIEIGKKNRKSKLEQEKWRNNGDEERMLKSKMKNGKEEKIEDKRIRKGNGE